MGLGKTLQTSTFISGLFFSKIIQMVMIIAPVSILESWSEELAVAGLKGLVHHICSTSDMKALQIVVKEGGILLTSYEMFTRHHKILESPSRRWDYVVLDEAHRIKNYEAHVTKAMKSIECTKKILMTGTPIPKNLLDIYSLMDFIQPGILGDKDTFDENFMYPIKKGQYSNLAKGDKEEYLKALARCWSTISPYLLRRNKSVLIESGDLTCKKHDVVIWLRLTKLQVKLYEKLYQLHHETTQFRSQEQEIPFTLSALYQSICNDPYLLWKILDDKKSGRQVKRLAGNLLESVDVDRPSYDNTRSSCKINFILDLIKQMFKEERNQPKSVTENMQGEGKGKKLKILVFCQQIYMMDRLEVIAPILFFYELPPCATSILIQWTHAHNRYIILYLVVFQAGGSQ
ncbi:protein CHROMATIN REMODELING 24-like [Hordeum vulgare subsp. vulgare]|uniref:protein CHROMATIN REMODELING 24-like n=1 Tax=Hordeum vulgare subsp. vulgare TaxID=112509 RepID=UPI001D1A3C9F|nr:protein CHROMATIN REMODELING 24-like [Hordeum vulgare subsp. vulgare]